MRVSKPPFVCALSLAVLGCSVPGADPSDASGPQDAGVLVDGRVSDGSDRTHDDADVESPADAAIEAPADAPADAPPLPRRPASLTYPAGQRHSPIDAAIAARLQSIASGNARVFAKVGDSITEDDEFFTCFGGGSIDFAGRTDLGEAHSYFLAGDAGGSSPFVRTSAAAVRGVTTQGMLSGSPSPLSRELSAIDPQFAVIMLGTNDIRAGRSYDAFGADLWTIVDQTIASGAIPILSTVPPNNADSTADARIPKANAIVRAIAQGRRIPLVDYHRELVPLASRGISSDGIHPSVSSSGACQLDSTGLQYGYNVRNLTSLEALSRARTAASGTALDGAVQRPSGNGRTTDPYVVPSSFVDLNDVRNRTNELSSYPCNSRAQRGGEVVYEIELSSQATIDALVVDRGSVDVDVHILQGSPTAQSCVAGGDHQASANVSAGFVYIVVDAPDDGSAGEYVLVVQTR